MKDLFRNWVNRPGGSCAASSAVVAPLHLRRGSAEARARGCNLLLLRKSAVFVGLLRLVELGTGITELLHCEVVPSGHGALPSAQASSRDLIKFVVISLFACYRWSQSRW